MKKITSFILALILAASVSAAAPDTGTSAVPGYDSGTNYYQKMQECAADGRPDAMRSGAVYEQQRNLKILELELPHATTQYFSTHETGDAILTAMKLDRLSTEHPTAGYVYEYLNRRGYSDVTIAAILGNMMAETGGQTLELDWTMYGDDGAYYGLCMWSLHYTPRVRGMGLDEQLDFLTCFIRQTMDQFGGDHKEFCAIQDPGEAARYFCLYYERGEGVSQRMKNARRAFAWINE